eukprot:scaffold113774_cov32-Tisochrysis_lutea.AAC.5
MAHARVAPSRPSTPRLRRRRSQGRTSTHPGRERDEHRRASYGEIAPAVYKRGVSASCAARMPHSIHGGSTASTATASHGIAEAARSSPWATTAIANPGLLSAMRLNARRTRSEAARTRISASGSLVSANKMAHAACRSSRHASGMGLARSDHVAWWACLPW